jgi:hypothetical protein
MTVDVALLAIVLASGLVLIATGLHERRLGRLAWASILVASLVGAVVLGAAWQTYARPHPDPGTTGRSANRPIEIEENGYVSSQGCRACHPHQYDTWHASYHRTMTQIPSEASVIADFDDHTLSHFGREFRFYREDGGYFMDMKDPRSAAAGEEASAETFEIVLSTGAHHQQAFWFAPEEGRSLGKLPFIWINEEQRWVPYGSIFVAPPSRPSMQTGLWNETCIRCHVVRGKPRKDEDVGYDSHVGEFGISCGACHGAAQEHAAGHRNPLSRYRQHFSFADDPSLVSAPDLAHERSSQVCGQCHAVFDLYDEEDARSFDREGFAYRPGDDLRETRHVFRHGQDAADPVVARKLERSPDFFERKFWSDGMVRVSGREYNGLLETPCHQRGPMSCLSCHSMHPDPDDPRPLEEWADDQLAPGMRGNPACLQCHPELEPEEALVAHTHHPPQSAGSSCYNCHMPHTTLGLMKAMRSHTVDVPDVAATVATGRPNACNLCHLDETLGWTAGYLSIWYGIAPPELTEDERTVAASVRWILEGDAGQRAIAGWHFGWEPAREASGTEWMAVYLAELLTDSYEVVRFIGYHALEDLPGFADFDYDYVGSEASRRKARLEASILWHEQGDPLPRSAALLIDAQGRLVTERLREIRNRRVDPIVILAE